MVVDVVNGRFAIGHLRFHISIFKDENDQPEQVSVTLAEGNDPVSKFLPALGMLITLCLQNKVPVTDLVQQMLRVPFEPAGQTNDSYIPQVVSVADYVCQRIALEIDPESRSQAESQPELSL